MNIARIPITVLRPDLFLHHIDSLLTSTIIARMDPLPKLIFLALLAIYILIKLAMGKAQHGLDMSANSAQAFRFSDIAQDPKFALVRTIHTKIRGVSYANSGGTSRQKIIRKLCHSGDALVLIREPDNPFDANAIQVRRIVCTKTEEPIRGEPLGYVSRELAADLAPHLDDGSICFAEIIELTGDLTGHDGGHVGLNIRIEEYYRLTGFPLFARVHRKQKRARE